MFDTAYAQNTSNPIRPPTTVVAPLPTPGSTSSLPISQTNRSACQNMYGAYMTNATDITATQCLCKNPAGTGNVDCLNLQSYADIMQPYCATQNPAGQLRSVSKKACECSAGLTVDGKECISNDAGNLGLSCSPDQMINGGCHLNIYKTLGIRQSDAQPLSPTAFVQDLVLSATSFVGVVITIVLIYTGFQAVMGGFSGEDSMANVKKTFTGVVKGLLLIMLSYTIVRAIQFVARGY